MAFNTVSQLTRIKRSMNDSPRTKLEYDRWQATMRFFILKKQNLFTFHGQTHFSPSHPLFSFTPKPSLLPHTGNTLAPFHFPFPLYPTTNPYTTLSSSFPSHFHETLHGPTLPPQPPSPFIAPFFSLYIPFSPLAHLPSPLPLPSTPHPPSRLDRATAVSTDALLSHITSISLVRATTFLFSLIYLDTTTTCSSPSYLCF